MTELQVEVQIDRLLETLDGELTSHSRVIDAFLDVRGATDNVHLIALVDDSLRNLPGKNATETEWVRQRLTYIGLMSAMSVLALGATLEAEVAATS